MPHGVSVMTSARRRRKISAGQSDVRRIARQRRRASPVIPGRIRWTVTAESSRHSGGQHPNPHPAGRPARQAPADPPRETANAHTTTNGSAGTTSVHSAGRLASSPLSSKKKTRSHCQVLQRFTNSNERPDNGWNRCVTRTRSGYFPPAASHAVDGPLEQHLRTWRPP